MNETIEALGKLVDEEYRRYQYWLDRVNESPEHPFLWDDFVVEHRDRANTLISARNILIALSQETPA